MKIKKIFQGTVPENKILNTESSSETDTYSCKYINEKFMKKEEIETVTNDNGTAIKFPDGTMICYGIVSATVSFTLWHSWYACQIPSKTFPQGFVSTPILNVNNSTTSIGATVSQISGLSNTSTGIISLARDNAVENATVSINYIAIGRWK